MKSRIVLFALMVFGSSLGPIAAAQGSANLKCDKTFIDEYFVDLGLRYADVYRRTLVSDFVAAYAKMGLAIQSDDVVFDRNHQFYRAQQKKCIPLNGQPAADCSSMAEADVGQYQYSESATFPETVTVRGRVHQLQTWTLGKQIELPGVNTNPPAEVRDRSDKLIGHECRIPFRKPILIYVTYIDDTGTPVVQHNYNEMDWIPGPGPRGGPAYYLDPSQFRKFVPAP